MTAAGDGYTRTMPRTGPLDDVANRVRNADLPDDLRATVRRLLSVGWLAKGLVFIVIGGLAVELARRGRTGRDADQTGALTTLVEILAGRVLVLAVSIALAGFAAWKIWAGFARDGDDPLGIAERIGSFGLGVVYGLLAQTGLRIAWQGGPDTTVGSDPGPTSPTGLTRRILDLPGGVFLVCAIGIGVGVVAGRQFWRAARAGFMDDVDTDDLTDRQRAGVRILGTFGIAARAMLLGIAGWLFVDAAIEENAGRAAGIDDALRRLSEVPLGTLLLVVTGTGLVASGLFDAVTFRRRRISDGGRH